MVSSVGSSSQSPAAVDTSNSALAATFDTFLKLLTTQLQNQDPLSPMDSAKFTEQLVQYSQVEQQIASNKKLDTLATQLATSSSMGSLSYLGRTALFDTRAASLVDGKASWQYALGADASKTTLSVQDAKGNTIYTTSGDVGAGAHTFTWDGKRGDGTTAPDGIYKLVATAKAGDNSAIETAIAVSERITGVDFSSAKPAVSTASGSHALSTIMRIQETAS
jgi:flagellar basal-body rod modification protein FlgD